MTIKAIIFDFGGVLLRTKSWEARHKWDARLGLAMGTIEHMVFNSDAGRAAQHGAVSEDAHWAWVAGQLGLDEAQSAEFRHDFWAGDQLDQALVTYIKSLRPRYKVAMISNYTDGLRAELGATWGIRDLFDRVVVSAEFGIMKPAPEIYQHCLALLEVAPSEAVFIDDFAHNIVGAEAMGMHGVHYPRGNSASDLAQAIATLTQSLE